MDMKKVLFATTALVATAGVASADIALSGSAEMGVRGGTGVTSQFHQDIDVTFTMSGTADNGLTFGAAIDIDESQGGAAFGGPDDGGVAIFISGDFGTLTLGDTDGALDWAMTEVNVAGASLGDDETAHAGFSGNSFLDGHYDGQILRYDYSFGDFSVAVSVEQDDDTITHGIAFNIPNGFGSNNAVTSDPIWAIGAKYSGMFAGGSFGVGIGYQWTDDGLDNIAGNQGVSVTGLSANVALDSGFSAAVNYSMIEVTGATAITGGNDDGTHMGIGIGYTFDAITVAANYGVYDWDAGAFDADAEGYGLVAQYDFGGGLAAHLGYGYSDVTAINGANTIGQAASTLGSSNTWSFGLSMSF
jgi:outer membrane protein OmpU